MKLKNEKLIGWFAPWSWELVEIKKDLKPTSPYIYHIFIANRAISNSMWMESTYTKKEAIDFARKLSWNLANLRCELNKYNLKDTNERTYRATRMRKKNKTWDFIERSK